MNYTDYIMCLNDARGTPGPDPGVPLVFVPFMQYAG